jgi:hypothetical protein
MNDEYIGVRKLAEFLVARQSQSGVSIDADDTALLALEIQHILKRIQFLDEILESQPVLAEIYKAYD